MKLKTLVYALGEENRPIGTEIEVEEEAGKELVEKGLAEEVKAKATPKKAPAKKTEK
jgi:hypothetical protein